jgi:hypothetical protein
MSGEVPDLRAFASENLLCSHEPAQLARMVLRMRAYLLEELRSDLRHGNFHTSDLIAVLSDLPPDDAWRHHDTVAGSAPDAWYLWRDPSAPNDLHADRAIVEEGKITSKWGCGINSYTECVPLDLPADVAAILAEDDAREAADG